MKNLIVDTLLNLNLELNSKLSSSKIGNSQPSANKAFEFRKKIDKKHTPWNHNKLLKISIGLVVSEIYN